MLFGFEVWTLIGIIAAIMTVLLFTLPFIVSCFVITPNKSVTILETFGKYSGLRYPGLSMKWPWPFQVKAGKVTTKIRELSANVNVKTNDNLYVEYPAKVQYYIKDSNAAEAFYDLENPEEQIQSYIFNTIRSEASSMSYDELHTSRERIEESVMGTLKDNIEGYGYTINNVLVDEPMPSRAVRDAIEAEKTAERQKLAARHEAEAIKIKLVNKAEAEAEAKKLAGIGMANMRIEVAKGNAEAMKLFKDTFGDSVDISYLMDYTYRIQELETNKDISENVGKNGIAIFGNSGSYDLGSKMAGNVASFKKGHDANLEIGYKSFKNEEDLANEAEQEKKRGDILRKQKEERLQPSSKKYDDILQGLNRIRKNKD